MHLKIRILTVFLTIALFPRLNAQGCSDAGFCTINSFKPQEASSENTQSDDQFKIGFSYGRADHDISIMAGYLEYNRQFSDQFAMDFRLTGIAQNGNEISVFGLSDLFMNANYAISPNARITLGAKVPLNPANKREDGLPLPMDYQSSLGTFDLIAGIGYDIGKLQLVLALQQPLSQNKNEFLIQDYPLTELRNFQNTNQFKRTGDVLLRVSYPLVLGNKFTLTPSLLPIYHLGKDRYTNLLNAEREIAGSDGLTLNATAYLDYTITDKSALQLNLGVPLVVRDVRPDGLTRSFVATLEYRVKF